jgi:excisionase family DNA binding protein
MDQPKEITPLAVTVAECCRLTSLSVVTIYDLLKKGQLSSTKIGRRRLIIVESIQRLLAPEMAKAAVAAPTAPKKRGRPRKIPALPAQPAI